MSSNEYESSRSGISKYLIQIPRLPVRNLLRSSNQECLDLHFPRFPQIHVHFSSPSFSTFSDLRIEKHSKSEHVDPLQLLIRSIIISTLILQSSDLRFPQKLPEKQKKGSKSRSRVTLGSGREL